MDIEQAAVGILERAENMYQEIGEILADERGLICRDCGFQLPLSAADAARYTARGWPKCCGRQMRTNKETTE